MIIFKLHLFTKSILECSSKFDIAISNHNLEHCFNWEETLIAICTKLKKGGFFYLAFPTEESIYYPKRKGTLNFLDDETHNINRPILNNVLSILNENNFEILKYYNNYSPLALFLLGLILEPLSSMYKRVMLGTWEYGI